ncbi:carbohydrate kinase [Cutibacterium acnes JCM 18920]|nr:carbohydrate kinase [Cutibacterium acnes JCM 18920]
MDGSHLSTSTGERHQEEVVMAEIVIGVDGGTTAVKAVAFNLSGDVVSTRRESVSVTYGDHGEAEQDMNQIWEAVATCIRSVADVLDCRRRCRHWVNWAGGWGMARGREGNSRSPCSHLAGWPCQSACRAVE